MKANALIIGNNNYLFTKKKLDNAINDADAIAKKLSLLGFNVDKETDCKNAGFAKALTSFCSKLENSRVALLFFSGHGLQIDGQNYLCNIDSQFEDEGSAKYTSIKLEEVIRDIDKANPKVKIIILDACRDNPFEISTRGGYASGLAPIYAPKGSIIAFSTSPGQTASDADGLNGKHSYFTKAILDHIDDKHIPIEEFFKRVRTSVYSMSEGKQLSWEHTSLIGDFFFNSGQLIQSIELPYAKETIADSTYNPSGSDIDRLITKFKSHDWYEQKPAFQDFQKLTPSKVDVSLQFLIGRNLLQTAIGGEWSTNDFFDNLGDNLLKWNSDNENHILNGILYEIYFDSEGQLRNGLKFKSELIDKIFKLEEDKRYISSINFINNQLRPFQDYILYLPSTKPTTIAIDITFQKELVENIRGVKKTIFYLKSLKHKEQELFKIKEEYFTYDSFVDFTNKISTRLSIPKNKLSMICNYNKDEIETVAFPWILEFSNL